MPRAGEWCADALAKAGLLATTSGAADSAAKADWRSLAGRDVTIWPDNDEAGQRYAEAVADALLALGCTVRVIEVEKLGLPEKGDAVDWLKANPAAVAADIAALPCVQAWQRDNAGSEIASRVTLTRGDALRVEPIRWLWDGRLARGKVHVMAGAPGTGKSTIALALVAVVATGGRWPDGTICRPADVLVWSGEDDPADTLLPRLLAAGGELRRVHFVSGAVDGDGPRLFDLATDIPALLTAAREIPDCDLAIIDPVVSAVAGDSHKNTEVRRALQPLVGFAAELGVAVLGISHFTKGTAGRDPVERVTGSVAFGALPRVVMAAAKVQDADSERRLFCRAKSNIGPDTGGWDYRLVLADVPGAPGVSVVRVQWGDALEGSARDLLAEAEAAGDPEERSATDEAEEWLRDLLKAGAVKAGDAQKAARRDGITDKVLRRARENLGIKPRKRSFEGGWWWELGHVQDAQDAQDAQDSQDSYTENVGTLGGKGHLGGHSDPDPDLAEGSL